MSGLSPAADSAPKLENRRRTSIISFRVTFRFRYTGKENPPRTSAQSGNRWKAHFDYSLLSSVCIYLSLDLSAQASLTRFAVLLAKHDSTKDILSSIEVIKICECEQTRRGNQSITEMKSHRPQIYALIRVLRFSSLCNFCEYDMPFFAPLRSLYHLRHIRADEQETQFCAD